MSILPYYLYDNIFSYILFQIYKNNRIINNNSHTINHLLNNNETIQYSLICKKIFTLIGNILSNNILNYNNYSLLNKLTNNDNNNNQSFKIINNNKLIKKYTKLSDYQKDYNNNNIEYNEIYIILKNQSDSVYVLNNINNYPSNVKFDLTIMNEPILDVNVREFTNIQYENNNINSINEIRIIGGIDEFDEAEGGFQDEDDDQILLKKIISLNPKKILCELTYNCKHKSYSQLFKCNTLESLTIDLIDHVEPVEISNIDNNNSKLESLTVPILFHDILRYIEIKKRSGGNTFEFLSETKTHQPLRNIESIVHDWNEMVKTLSNNSKIKELNLINFCEEEWDECNIAIPKTLSINQQNEQEKEEEQDRADTSFVTLGLSEILLSPKTNIRSLMFIGTDFIDQHLISALENNKTIHSLTFQFANLPPNFNTLLSVNKNIRNLALDGFGNQIKDLLGLLKDKNIGLYSVSILTHNEKDFTSLLNLIKNTTFITLKEFYLFRMSNQRSVNQFKINNTIVTISKFSFNSYKLY